MIERKIPKLSLYFVEKALGRKKEKKEEPPVNWKLFSAQGVALLPTKGIGVVPEVVPSVQKEALSIFHCRRAGRKEKKSKVIRTRAEIIGHQLPPFRRTDRKGEILLWRGAREEGRPFLCPSSQRGPCRRPFHQRGEREEKKAKKKILHSHL